MNQTVPVFEDANPPEKEIPGWWHVGLLAIPIVLVCGIFFRHWLMHP